jgi:hypothetical protein
MYHTSANSFLKLSEPKTVGGDQTDSSLQQYEGPVFGTGCHQNDDDEGETHYGLS